MSAARDHSRRNRAWTRELLEREVAHNRQEATVLREHARRLLEKAFILEREADLFEAQLAAEAA